MSQTTLSSTIDLPNLTDAASTLLTYIQESETPVPSKLFGSVAISLRCPNSIRLWRKLHRKLIRDIDVITQPQYRNAIRDCLVAHGIQEDAGTDATNFKYQRLYFYWAAKDLVVEVHSAPLLFHHEIHADCTLGANPMTVSLADLAISKLQWDGLEENNVQVNREVLLREKEALRQRPRSNAFKITKIENKLRVLEENTAQLVDLCVLFAEHPISHGTEMPSIAVECFLSASRRDWGLWITLQRSLTILEDFAKGSLTEQEESLTLSRILSSIATLQSALIDISNVGPLWKLKRFIYFKAPPLVRRRLPVGYPVEEYRDDIWVRSYEGDEDGSRQD